MMQIVQGKPKDQSQVRAFNVSVLVPALKLKSVFSSSCRKLAHHLVGTYKFPYLRDLHLHVHDSEQRYSSWFQLRTSCLNYTTWMVMIPTATGMYWCFCYSWWIMEQCCDQTRLSLWLNMSLSSLLHRLLKLVLHVTSTPYFWHL